MQPISQRSMTSELTKKIDDAGIIAVLIIDEVKNNNNYLNGTTLDFPLLFMILTF